MLSYMTANKILILAIILILVIVAVLRYYGIISSPSSLLLAIHS